MSETTEAAPRKFTFAPPPEQSVELWRTLLKLDRGVRTRWALKEERRPATRARFLRPVGANADAWKRIVMVGGDSATIAAVRRQKEEAAHGAAVDDFIGWLDSEDFGDDPDRIRHEAWR